MEIHWYEQSLADVHDEDDWLSTWEKSHLSRLGFPKRRSDWRLGRWTAKLAVAHYLHLPVTPVTLAGIEILPSASGAPEVFVPGALTGVSISLSHRDGVAACAVADAGGSLGCDLEVVEPRSEAFVFDYFTANEQLAIQLALPPDRNALIALMWSAKESALKALRTGLRSDTRSVCVLLDNFLNHGPTPRIDVRSFRFSRPGVSAWLPLQVSHDSNVFYGFWCGDGRFVRTLVASTAGAPLSERTPSRISKLPVSG